MIEYVFAMEILRTSCVLFIILLTGVLADCPVRTYKYSEECLACPLHCTYCNSNTNCNSCDNGYSGKICSKQCDNCKPDSKCTKDAGICEEGCKDGLAGQYCNKACDSRCRSCIRKDPKKCTTCKNGIVCELVCPVDCYLHDCNKTCEHICLHNCKEDMPSTETWQVPVAVLAILLVMAIIVPLVTLIYKRKQNRQQRPSLPSVRYNVATEKLHQSGGGFQDATKVSEISERNKVSSTTSMSQDNAGRFSGGNDSKTAYTSLFENDSEHQYRPITKIHYVAERSGDLRYEDTRGVEHQFSDIASAYITPL